MKPTEIAALALDRLSKVDPALHAFTHIEAEGALKSAAELEAALLRGEVPGPLCGVPVAIKDLICTADMPTTFGSKLYESFVPREDDVCVARLRAAGAIILGKTNCSEFGYGGVGHNPVFPTTRNPWNPEMTSGGSSAGSAVAVATGICPVALGSDGGGSIRLPAAFTGIFGMKASMGRVPLWPGCRDPELPGASSWESLEHIGPLARNVGDCALVLSVIAGPDPRDRRSIPSTSAEWLDALDAPVRSGLRVAYCENWADVAVDPEIAEITRAACADFCTRIKAKMTIAQAPNIPLSLFRAIVARDSDLEGMRSRFSKWGIQPSRAIAAVLAAGPPDPATAFNLMRAVNALTRFMAGFDLIITPSTACLPFPVDMEGPGMINGSKVADDAWTPAAFPMNLTGQPVISVPVGFSKSGLPIGMQIVGPHLGDFAVISAAVAFETTRIGGADAEHGSQLLRMVP